jgi:hypothetical protein
MAPALDTNEICAEIAALLREPVGYGAESMLARIERTLTDGFAHALALEGEQRRLEHRITDAAGALHEGDRDVKADELTELSDRLGSARAEVRRLREQLAALRSHAALVRRAAA